MRIQGVQTNTLFWLDFYLNFYKLAVNIINSSRSDFIPENIGTSVRRWHDVYITTALHFTQRSSYRWPALLSQITDFWTSITPSSETAHWPLLCLVAWYRVPWLLLYLIVSPSHLLGRL